jgi:hypothetical protein
MIKVCDHFAFDGERTLRHTIFDGTVIVEGDESESAWSPRFFIHHQRRIKNSSKLFKIFLEFLFDDILSDPSNKDL